MKCLKHGKQHSRGDFNMMRSKRRKRNNRVYNIGLKSSGWSQLPFLQPSLGASFKALSRDTCVRAYICNMGEISCLASSFNGNELYNKFLEVGVTHGIRHHESQCNMCELTWPIDLSHNNTEKPVVTKTSKSALCETQVTSCVCKRNLSQKFSNMIFGTLMHQDKRCWNQHH